MTADETIDCIQRSHAAGGKAPAWSIIIIPSPAAKYRVLPVRETKKDTTTSRWRRVMSEEKTNSGAVKRSIKRSST